MKILADLMLVGMIVNLESNHLGTHPHPKHYLSSLLEITFAIHELSTKNKKIKLKI